MAQVTINNPAGDPYVSHFLNDVEIQPIRFRAKARDGRGNDFAAVLDTDLLRTDRFPKTVDIEADGSFVMTIPAVDTAIGLDEEGLSSVHPKTTTAQQVFYNWSIINDKDEELFSFDAQVISTGTPLTLQQLVGQGTMVVPAPVGLINGFLTALSVNTETNVLTATVLNNPDVTVDLSHLIDDTNSFVTAATLSTNTNILTLTVSGQSDVTVDLKPLLNDTVLTGTPSQEGDSPVFTIKDTDSDADDMSFEVKVVDQGDNTAFSISKQDESTDVVINNNQGDIQFALSGTSAASVTSTGLTSATRPPATNDTTVATTAFVQAAIGAIADNNDFVTGATLNAANNILTLAVQNQANPTVDLKPLLNDSRFTGDPEVSSISPELLFAPTTGDEWAVKVMAGGTDFQVIRGSTVTFQIGSTISQFNIPVHGPTAAVGTNTQQLATTAFVLANRIAFTGLLQADTPTLTMKSDLGDESDSAQKIVFTDSSDGVFFAIEHAEGDTEVVINNAFGDIVFQNEGNQIAAITAAGLTTITQSAGNSSTSVATTAFVNAALPFSNEVELDLAFAGSATPVSAQLQWGTTINACVTMSYIATSTTFGATTNTAHGRLVMVINGNTTGTVFLREEDRYEISTGTPIPIAFTHDVSSGNARILYTTTQATKIRFYNIKYTGLTNNGGGGGG